LLSFNCSKPLHAPTIFHNDRYRPTGVAQSRHSWS
jgi:hypothetical protein